MNEQDRAVNAYLKEENRVLRELHGKKRLRFGGNQRRRLAAKRKERFHEILGYAGVAQVRSPARSPNLNGYAKRLVFSIKSERLDRMIVLAERYSATG